GVQAADDVVPGGQVLELAAAVDHAPDGVRLEGGDHVAGPVAVGHADGGVDHDHGRVEAAAPAEALGLHRFDVGPLTDHDDVAGVGAHVQRHVAGHLDGAGPGAD